MWNICGPDVSRASCPYSLCPLAKQQILRVCVLGRQTLPIPNVQNFATGEEGFINVLSAIEASPCYPLCSTQVLPLQWILPQPGAIFPLPTKLQHALHSCSMILHCADWFCFWLTLFNLVFRAPFKGISGWAHIFPLVISPTELSHL